MVKREKRKPEKKLSGEGKWVWRRFWRGGF